jgi:hypothetical protein
MRRMAAHGDLIVLQIARAGAARRPSDGFCRVPPAAGARAQLRSHAKDVAQDVFEEGFERRDGGGDEACVELGADPDCEAGSVVCEDEERGGQYVLSGLRCEVLRWTARCSLNSRNAHGSRGSQFAALDCTYKSDWSSFPAPAVLCI